MAFDRLEINAPSDIHKMFTDNHAAMTRPEELAKPDFKNAFNQSARFGAAEISPDEAQNMGMEQAINPAEPIRIEPEQKVGPAIDPREITTRAEISGQFLQDMKMGVQVQPGMKANDSIFGAACNTVSNEVQGISHSLGGAAPDMAGMDPRLLQTNMNFAMKMQPGGLF